MEPWVNKRCRLRAKGFKSVLQRCNICAQQCVCLLLIDSLWIPELTLALPLVGRGVSYGCLVKDMSGWQRQRDHGKCDTRVPLTGRDGRCWQPACQPPLGAWRADRRTGALPLWRNKLLRLEVNAHRRHARADESFCLTLWAGCWGGYEDERRGSEARSMTVVLTLINSALMNRVRLTRGCRCRGRVVNCLHPVTVREDTSFQSSNWDENVKWLPRQRAWRRLFWNIKPAHGESLWILPSDRLSAITEAWWHVVVIMACLVNEPLLINLVHVWCSKQRKIICSRSATDPNPSAFHGAF